MPKNISVIPVSNDNEIALDLLKQAVQGDSKLFSIQIFDDSIRVKNICSDITINSNGSKKHIPCASYVDLFPGQKFSVDNLNFQVK